MDPTPLPFSSQPEWADLLLKPTVPCAPDQVDALAGVVARILSGETLTWDGIPKGKRKNLDNFTVQAFLRRNRIAQTGWDAENEKQRVADAKKEAWEAAQRAETPPTKEPEQRAVPAPRPDPVVVVRPTRPLSLVAPSSSPSLARETPRRGFTDLARGIQADTRRRS